MLEQLRNRLFEDNFNIIKESQVFFDKAYKFNEFEINTKKDANKFCILSSGVPYMVTKFFIENSHQYAMGFKCLDITPFFFISYKFIINRHF